MDPIPFPRDLDAPQRLFFWTIDQIAVFAVMFVFGMLLGRLLLFAMFGVAGGWLLSRYRDSRPDGYTQHLCYWYGILPLRGRAVLNPFLRIVHPA